MGLFPKEYEKNILADSKQNVQSAASKFQWGIVDGFDCIDEIDFKILNSLYIGSYPQRYRKMKIPSFSFSHTEGADDFNVGFTNLTLYKTFSQYNGLKKYIDKWVKENKDEKKVIVAYAMTSPFVELLNYIKRKHKQVVCCLVVPDLPEYMNVSERTNLLSYVKEAQIKHYKKALRTVDCFVLLTKYMAEWFDWDVKYTVVEGISAKATSGVTALNSQRENKILYTGMIEKKYGLMNLVESFMEINAPDWTLELYGNGSAVEEIRELSKKDSRIRLNGTVPNSVVVEEQKKAAILVNPRDNTNEFTKYSFPSKVIEYLSSGTSVVAYKLTGMPDEYTDYFYEIPEVEGGMKKTLETVMSLSSDDRVKMGARALEFMQKEKSAEVQCRKIVELLESCF